MRLDKYLSDCSGVTRTQARRSIRSGAVSVCGSICRDASTQVGDADTVRLLGRAIEPEQTRVVMMDKPAGYITAASDATLHSNHTVCSLLPIRYAKFMPIGRLDVDTTGLLLFTSDGELAHRVISPKYRIPKKYAAKIDRPITDDDVDAFAGGLALHGFTALPALLERGENAATATVTVYEGKFHQVKRMFASRGIAVVKLRRLSVAGICVSGVGEGETRPLTDDEECALYEAVGLRRGEG